MVAFVLKNSALILSTCFLFTLGAYFYNGRGTIVRNAAEYNYPLILNAFLDTSNQEKLDIAFYYARSGEHWEIANDLTAMGAKR